MTLGMILSGLETVKPNQVAFLFMVKNKQCVIILKGKEVRRLESAIKTFIDAQ